MPEDSDLRTASLQIECKRDQKEENSSISLNKDWLSKLTRRAQTSGKLPLLVTAHQNIQKTCWVHMPIHTFLHLIDPNKI
jgi:chloramphenicol 3-O-phosphotransferase